jgi:hypothetical protein
LTGEGTKVVFKVKKEKQGKTTEHTTGCDFKTILHDLVNDTENKQVLQFYELIVNNKDVILL